MGAGVLLSCPGVTMTSGQYKVDMYYVHFTLYTRYWGTLPGVQGGLRGYLFILPLDLKGA